MSYPEARIQRQIAGWLSWALPDGYRRFAIDHATGRPERLIYRKALGFERGLPDLLILGHDCFVGWLEIKTEKGVVRPEQRAFLDMAAGYGHHVGVARSLLDAQEIVGGWGVQLRTTKRATERITRVLAASLRHTAAERVVPSPDTPQARQD